MEECPGGGLNQQESKFYGSTSTGSLKQKEAAVETLPAYEPVFACLYLVFMQLYNYCDSVLS